VNGRIYLDHNATTPLDPSAREAMLPFLDHLFGNPSSIHHFGQQSRAALEQARGQVAALISAQPSEIVFTASGTEADNLALQGVARSAREPRRQLVVTSIEHHAVLNTAKALIGDGVPVALLRSGKDGKVDLDELRARVDDHTALVSVMLANNETGVIQPIEEVVEIARRGGALVHCDAVQAAGKLPIDVGRLGVDLLTLSAHKLYGPKGAGALFVRRGTRMSAQIRGGSQERNRRAGTESVADLVGFGRAAERAAEGLVEEARRQGALRDRLERRLLAVPGAALNGGEPRVANTTNLSFEGIDAESLLMALDLAGVAVSSGAACAAGAVEPSHVLRAMGLRAERVESSIRISLGRGNTEEEVDLAAARIVDAIEAQRQRSGDRGPAQG
jgi:cysteine desulfurase